jgi:DeoR/GlpR family transcriptional regulator of sugar metabolism
MQKDIFHRLLATEREQLVLGHVRESEVAPVAELCQARSVSEVTVRRNLQSRHARGFLERIHDGAGLKPHPRENKPIFMANKSKCTKKMQRIAAKVANLVVEIVAFRAPGQELRAIPSETSLFNYDCRMR